MLQYIVVGRFFKSRIMNPEIKAKELVSKMYGSEIEDFEAVAYHFHDGFTIALDSAIIAVNLLIEHSNNIAMIYDLSFDKSTSYWNKVKEELEKL